VICPVQPSRAIGKLGLSISDVGYCNFLKLSDVNKSMFTSTSMVLFWLKQQLGGWWVSGEKF